MPSAAAVDLRLVVDVSAATEAADAAALRRGALEFFVRGLPDDASAGIWSYGNYVRQVAKYAQTDGLWKQVATIRSASLGADGPRADLPGALQAASWDMAAENRGAAHIVVLGSGAIRIQAGADAQAQARQQLLGQWSKQLRKARIHVHTLAIGAEAEADLELLRQLAEISGGLHRVVGDAETLSKAMLDVQRRIEVQLQAQPDQAGRFQVAPGAERLTLTWMQPSTLASAPSIRTPDGRTLSRLSHLKDGRWVHGEQFEMVTLNTPQPGWWQVQGPAPDNLAVFGELDVKVEGVDATVVPTDESSATIRLYNQGRRITHTHFLKLLNVRAWVVIDDERRPLPVDPLGDGFVAHFVNLDDGAQDLVIEITAPTFTRNVVVPFVVANPLAVELMSAESGEAMAWLQFSHPEVDYSTVRATGIVRKPPQIASLVPAEKMPGGLWRIPLGHSDGIVEAAFSVAGNYLDGKGVYIKTKPHAISLPLTEDAQTVLRYDAQGKLISEPAAAVMEHPIVVENPAVTARGEDLPSSVLLNEESPAPEPSDPVPLLPWWFVALISMLNLALAGIIWWFNRPKPLPFAAA